MIKFRYHERAPFRRATFLERIGSQRGSSISPVKGVIPDSLPDPMRAKPLKDNVMVVPVEDREGAEMRLRLVGGEQEEGRNNCEGMCRRAN
jgi:hypothetical protein